jgi:hypothetical protein
MTRKHYKALAAALAAARPQLPAGSTKHQLAQYETWLEIRGNIMEALQELSDNFDRRHFINATEEPNND